VKYSGCIQQTEFACSHQALRVIISHNKRNRMFNNIIGWHPVGTSLFDSIFQLCLQRRCRSCSLFTLIWRHRLREPHGLCTFGAESPEELTGTPLIDLVTSDYRSPLRERVAHIYGGDERTSGLNVELQTDTDQPQRAILVSSVVEWDDTERVQTSVFPITGTPSDSDRLLYNRHGPSSPRYHGFGPIPTR